MLKNPPVKQVTQETRVQSQGQEDPLEKEMATQVFLPGKCHGQRDLVGYSRLLFRWGCKEPDTTQRLNSSSNKDFPGGPVVKNPPDNAGNTDQIPGPQIKIPHDMRKLSLHAATTEPSHPRACATREALAPQLESNPSSPQLEKAHRQQ